MADRQPEQSSSSNQFMAPPRDLAFNNFLANISRLLHEKDLEEIKLRFRGIINTDVNTWAEAFHFLVIKRYISEDNLIYLQLIIRVLNRADLLATTIEYARKSQQRVLHFYETTTDIRPNHRYVRIHVEGGSCQTGGDLDAIRRAISEILWVPLEDIVVGGIQEANSLYITFTLPSIYVETLEKFLEDKTKHHILRPLVKLGIDRIIISETSFKLKPEETQIADEKSNRNEIITKLQLELQQNKSEIKNLEEEILRQRRYKDGVSQTPNESSGKQSNKKRRPLSGLKMPGRKRSKRRKRYFNSSRVSPRRSKRVISLNLRKLRKDLAQY